MKSNYALASFPLKCNLDHLSELLKRELPWRLTGNTCSNHCEGSFSGEPASLLALCNLKYGVTFSWAAFLAKIFISKKSGTAGYTDLYLHTRGGEKRMVRNKRDQNRKLRLNRHPTLVTNTASRAMPLIHLGTLNKTSYIKILIFFNYSREISRNCIFHCLQWRFSVWKFYLSSFQWHEKTGNRHGMCGSQREGGSHVY